MLKKSLKYLLIVFINFLILNLLLLWWTDDIELITGWARPVEFLKLSCLSLLVCIALRILVAYFGNKSIQPISKRLKIAAIVTVLLSSYFYVHYFSKIVHNRFLYVETRDSAAEKISFSAGGYKADSLTIQEYNEIKKTTWFPSLPKEASAIKLSYACDGFLPDYLFALSYNLPSAIKVDTFSFEKGDFIKYQNTEIDSNLQRVTYEELVH